MDDERYAAVNAAYADIYAGRATPRQLMDILYRLYDRARKATSNGA